MYVDMVADLFHYGHMEFLRKAREMGTYLIAGIVADVLATSKSGTLLLRRDQGEMAVL